MPWRENRGGTGLQSLTVSLLMPLTMLALILTLIVRYNLGPPQVRQLRINWVIRWNASKTASWEPLGPKQGCMGSTNAPVPGLALSTPQNGTTACLQPSRQRALNCIDASVGKTVSEEGGRKPRRIPASSRALVQHSLQVAQEKHQPTARPHPSC